jgi:hypothetical protein
MSLGCETKLAYSDKGFGTAYETYILKTILDKTKQKYNIRRVVEYPPSDLLENSLLEDEPRTEGASVSEPDLVWNFCCFEQREDSHEVISEALQRTTSYVMVVIQNCRNPGVIMHWTYHKLSGRRWDHGKVLRMRPKVLRGALREMKLEVIDQGFFDVPWFILDVYECGGFLRKLVPGSLVDDRHVITPSRFEKMPKILKSILAHHYYAIARKTGQS